MYSLELRLFSKFSKHIYMYLSQNPETPRVLAHACKLLCAPHLKVMITGTYSSYMFMLQCVQFVILHIMMKSFHQKLAQ